MPDQLEAIARTIGAEVRAGRARKGLTRKGLARAAGVSERYLNELENGLANASVAILVKVSAALDIDTVRLITGSDRTAAAAPETPAKLFETLTLGLTPGEQEAALAMLSDWLAARRRHARGVALLGLRGAGKSTLGGRLADRHGLAFVSVTREIEAQSGMSLGDLFNLGGPAAYRALECDVIARIARDADGVLLETAGGLVDNPPALAQVLASFTTIWLKASPAEHLARVVAQGDMRPADGHPGALEHVEALLAARQAGYARATHVIDTTGRSVEASLGALEQIAGPLITRRASAG